MQRRRFLILGGATLSTALAGCLGGDDNGDPESVVESYWEAIDDLDPDAANELIHPDALDEPLTDDDMIFFDGLEITVLSTELIEEDEDEAIVEAVIEVDSDELSEPEEETTELLLERYEGQWLIMG